MSKLIKENYVEYLKSEKRLSGNTIEAYSRDVSQFKKYLKENNHPLFMEINKTTIITYLLYLQKSGRSNSTISRNLASIRCFYQFLFSKHLINEDPTINLKSLKSEKKIPTILTTKEVNLFLSQPKTDSLKGSRDKAMMELIYASGLRVSQIILLNIEDIDIDSSLIHIREEEHRVIPLGSVALKYIDNYLKDFRDKAIKTDPLFINMRGNRLSRQGFWKILKEYGEDASIEKKITPQVLRHSFAAHMVSKGANLKVIQEILGHANLSTTEIYSFASDEDRLRDIYKKTHPRA